MKAGEKQIIRFLQEQDIKFVIPVYQRNYDWTEVQCKQLLDDIYSVSLNKKPSHFIGSIVFIHDDVFTTGLKDLTIIDGQQRLTTITLLWLVLYKKALETNNEKLSNEVYKKYLVNEFIDSEEEKLKLKPTQNNDLALKALIRGDFKETFTDYSRIIENYKYFYSRIKNEDLEIVKNGISKLLFVEISLERGKDDPQKIFQSLNSTGLDLSEGDLIRNYILIDLKPKEQEKIYKNYWMIIESLTIEKENNKNKLSDFIRDFITLKFREIPNKNKVFEAFQSRYKFNQNFEELENIMKEIKKYANIYSKLINPLKEGDSEIKKQINLISKLETNVSYPFLLEVYNDYEEQLIDKNTFLEVLSIIQSFIWRRFICDVSTNSLNKIFFKLYQDIDKENYIESLQKTLISKRGTQKFPNDENVYNQLRFKDIYSVQSKKRVYFLERLENYDNNEPVQIEGNDKITIEHIFPKTPDLKWKELLTENEYNQIETKYLDTISNLTLSGNNSSLSNKTFIEKRDLPEKGYKDSKLFLNKYLSNINKWDLEELENRFEIIFERFKKIWKYPNNLVATTNNNIFQEEINIFEQDIEPTFKEIEYIVFFQQKIELKTFIELLTSVASRLFDLEPQGFFNTDLRDRLKLTDEENVNTLRTPVKISGSYYIEGHGSSTLILSKVKYMLVKFEMQDELIIKFKN